MDLFHRLYRCAHPCCHKQSAQPLSEIKHNAIRRYYWVCSRCGAKVYIEDWKGNAGLFQGVLSRQATTKLSNIIAA